MKKLHTAIDEQMLNKMRLLERMTLSARSRLPREVAAHCWIGGYDSTSLSVITDNTAYSTVIYYQQAEVLKQLNEEFGIALKCRFTKMRVHAVHTSIHNLGAMHRRYALGTQE